MFSPNQKHNIYNAGVLCRIMRIKPALLFELNYLFVSVQTGPRRLVVYFSSHWCEETGGLFQSVLLQSQ